MNAKKERPKILILLVEPPNNCFCSKIFMQ